MITYKYNRTNLAYFAIIIFVIDQFSKFIALQMLDFDREYVVNSFVSFHRIFNQNTFMLNQTLPVSIEIYKLIWVVIALVLSFGIFWVTKQPALMENSWEAEFARTGLFIILGGCLGNAYDVIFRFNGVIDFIRLNFLETIPILNFADVMIYFGEFCLIITWIIILVKYFLKLLKRN